MRVKLRRVGIRFKKGYIENRVKSRKIGRKCKLICETANFSNNWIRTKSLMVEFARRMSSLDISM